MRKSFLVVAVGLLGGLWAQNVPVTFLELQRMADEARASGKKTLVLQRGRLHIDTETVVLSNLENFTLEGAGPGVTLVGHTLRPVLILRNCRQITLRNFAVDYDPLPFTQVVVTETTRDSVRYRVLPAYPELDKAYLSTTALHFEKNTRDWSPFAREIYFAANTALSADQGLLTGCRSPGGLRGMQLGDRLVLVARHAPAILASDCRDVTAEGLTIFAAPSVGLLFRYLSGSNRILRLRVDRGPKLQPAMEDRLLSTGSSAVVLGVSTGATQFENMSAAWSGGDGIHTLGAVFPVLSGEGWVYRVGDRFGDLEHLTASGRKPLVFRGLAGESFVVKGEAPVLAMVHDKPPGESATTRLVFDGIMEQRLRGGDFLDLPAWNGGALRVEGSSFRKLRGVGIRHGSASLMVTRSVFEGLTAGSVICPAAYDRGEAGWGGLMVLDGNAFVARELPGGLVHPLEGPLIRFQGPPGVKNLSHSPYRLGENLVLPPGTPWVENPPGFTP